MWLIGVERWSWEAPRPLPHSQWACSWWHDTCPSARQWAQGPHSSAKRFCTYPTCSLRPPQAVANGVLRFAFGDRVMRAVRINHVDHAATPIRAEGAFDAAI